MKVPQGFEKLYPKNVALLLLRTIYGLVQAALVFWRETVAAFRYSMNYISGAKRTHVCTLSGQFEDCS
jgi:hypothetical protein